MIPPDRARPRRGGDRSGRKSGRRQNPVSRPDPGVETRGSGVLWNADRFAVPVSAACPSTTGYLPWSCRGAPPTPGFNLNHGPPPPQGFGQAQRPLGHWREDGGPGSPGTLRTPPRKPFRTAGNPRLVHSTGPSRVRPEFVVSSGSTERSRLPRGVRTGHQTGVSIFVL